MRPTDLTARQRQPVIGTVAIGDDDTGHEFSEQRLGLRLATRDGSAEGHPQRGSRYPQPTPLIAVAPTGLVAVHHLRLAYGLLDLGGDLFQRRGQPARGSRED